MHKTFIYRPMHGVSTKAYSMSLGTYFIALHCTLMTNQLSIIKYPRSTLVITALYKLSLIKVLLINPQLIADKCTGLPNTKIAFHTEAIHEQP